jgi:hypothetical protein
MHLQMLAAAALYAQDEDHEQIDMPSVACLPTIDFYFSYPIQSTVISYNFVPKKYQVQQVDSSVMTNYDDC